MYSSFEMLIMFFPRTRLITLSNIISCVLLIAFAMFFCVMLSVFFINSCLKLCRPFASFDRDIYVLIYRTLDFHVIISTSVGPSGNRSLKMIPIFCT